MRTDVEFPGFGGTCLRGWLYVPDGEKPGPGVVVTHGFSGVKEMFLDRFAEVFCAGGLSVLVYDHRNFGSSDGEPRQEINPWAQARDYRYALTWLAERSEVDAARLGIWGSSFSGGEVLVVGACDERVKAVVANVPFAGLPGADYADTRQNFEALRANLLDESGEGFADAEGTVMGPVCVVPEEGVELPAFLPQPESVEFFLQLGRDRVPSWKNQVTLRNAFGTDPAYDPGVCVEHLGKPLLMVVASEDQLAETAITLAAFERAREPKQLELIVGHHFVPYVGAAFESAAGAARDFFLAHL
jgi:pimeloyl-ACP methyl ester carboxylesterase